MKSATYKYHVQTFHFPGSPVTPGGVAMHGERIHSVLSVDRDSGTVPAAWVVTALVVTTELPDE